MHEGTPNKSEHLTEMMKLRQALDAVIQSEQPSYDQALTVNQAMNTFFVDYSRYLNSIDEQESQKPRGRTGIVGMLRRGHPEYDGEVTQLRRASLNALKTLISEAIQLQPELQIDIAQLKKARQELLNLRK